MAHIDEVYNAMVHSILDEGYWYKDKSRGDMLMKEIPSYTLDIDMLQGFPLLTTKRVYWKAVLHELIWFLTGVEDIRYLQDNGVHIWDKDVANFDTEEGTHAGRVYGPQWRDWQVGDGHQSIDQIQELIEGMKDNIHNRRLMVTAWNPAEMDLMALPPCHYGFQIIPTKGGFGLKWNQRSCDTFLGIPFNIASYAALGRLLEEETGIKFTRLIGNLSCVHIYGPHIELIEEQMARRPKRERTRLHLTKGTGVDNLVYDDFRLCGYNPHEAIKGEMYAKVK